MKISSISHIHKSYIYGYKTKTKLKTIAFFLIIISNFALTSCGGLEVEDLSVHTNLEDMLIDTSHPQTQRRTIDHENTVTPTRLVPPSKVPIWFVDDLNFRNMDLAIHRQLQYFQRYHLTGKIKFGNDLYDRAILPFALKKFQRLYHAYHDCLRQVYNIQNNTCAQAFHNTLINQFHIYEPDINPVNRDNPTKFTGYYVPTIPGSMRRTREFRYPVYSTPRENHLRTLTRYQIHFQHLLAGHGYELFYTNDLFTIYNMQIQGSGKVRFVDGNRSIYAAIQKSNGYSWTFISRYMKRRGMIRYETVAEQKAYLDANPHRQAEIYKQSPVYSFYRFSDIPPGSRGIGVTDGRSIATDDKYYVQKGTLAFVQAKKPNYELWRRTGQVKMQPFSRFALDQDTGGKIIGKARVDFYFGETKYAEIAAQSLNTYGKLFFLMPKQIP